MRLTDAAAIAAARDDPQAFTAVFDRHFVAIHRYLASRVGAALADELAAEVFERAFDARRKYDTSYEDARPWLYAIATNLVHRARRAERRRLAAYARLDPGGGGIPRGGRHRRSARRSRARARRRGRPAGPEGCRP